MSIEKFCKRMKDENVGPKNQMIHLNIGGGCITRYIGPLTLAHAEYIKARVDRQQEEIAKERALQYVQWMAYYEEKLTEFKALSKEEQEELIKARRQPRKPEHYNKTFVTIIELERPRYACDPITKDDDAIVFKV